jgi:PKD repeat protein
MKYGVIVISAVLVLSAFVMAMDTTGATDPHLEGYKSIAPGSIFAEGKGSPDKATIDMTVQGAGDPYLKSFPQDVVFVIDSSGSMKTRDPYDERKEAAKYYVDQLDSSIDERAAVVDFDSDAFLVPESNPFGDHLSTEYPRVKDNINQIDSDGNTNIPAGMLIANEELIDYGWEGNTWNAILLTDGQNAPTTRDVEMDDPDDPVVKDAIDNGIRYFTVGLGDSVNAMLLMNLANMTGGSYHPAATADELQQIYDDIHEEVMNTAAKSVTVTQTLKPEFEYVNGSFSVAPTSLSGNVATWEIPSLSIGEYWDVTFDVASETCGYQMDVDEMTMVTYIAFDGSTQNLTLPSVQLDVVGCYSPPVADAGGPYSGNEGSPIQFDASGSYSPGNGTLSYRWDFDNDGTWDTEWMSDPTVERTWYDDYSGVVVLEVMEGNLTDADNTTVTVNNVAPVVIIDPDLTIDEGETVSLSGTFLDPGLDDTFTYTWDFDDGTSISGAVTGTGNLLVNGDFSNGLTGWSTAVEAGTTVLQVVVLDDDHDNVLEINNPISDGDGDWDWAYQTLNLDVSGYSFLYFEADGKPIYQSLSDDGWVGGEYPVHFSIRYQDVDGAWHDGQWTDNPWQQGFYYKGTGQYSYSNKVTQNSWFHYKSGNLMDLSPKPAVIGNVKVGSSGWAYHGMIDNVMLYGFPTLTTSHTYGDNGVFSVTLTVTDDDNGTATASTNVTVLNVNPEITDINVTVLKNAPRTQGYWNHQCTVTVPYGDHTGILQEWIDEIGIQSQVFAGISSKDEVCDILDPDDRSNMLLKAKQQLMAVWLNVASGKLNLLSPLDLPALTSSMTVGDAIDEMENIILTVSDKDELERAKDIADSMNNFIGVPVGAAIISVDAGDPGSDDLTFEWDWDDGNIEAHVYYNDGANPDPYPSPWGTFPFSASDSATHAYYSAGVYTIELTVKDDDGGAATYTITVDLL